MTWRPCLYARQWPELWAPLTESQRRVLSMSLAEDEFGCVPSRHDIEELAAYVAGTLSADEFEQRAEWRSLGSVS